MGNPYTGVMVAPLTDRVVSREQSGRLNVKRVKSIACLERMIKDPTHDCDPSQLLPGEGDPGLVNAAANVHSTHSSDAISVAAAAAQQAAEAAQAAAEAAKAAANAAAAAQKGHALDVQKAVQAAAKAAADAAADAVKVNPEDALASAKDAAVAAAEESSDRAPPRRPSSTFGGNLIGDLFGGFGGGTSLIHAEPPVIVHHKLRRSMNVR